MADSTILIEIKSDGTGARVIKRDLDEIAKKSDNTTRGVDRLKGAFVGLAGVLSVRAFTRFADSITSLDTKLRNVTDTVADSNKVFNDLFKVAQNNGDSIQGLAQSYSSLSVVLSDTLKEQTDLVKVTDLLSRGFAASSASAQTAAGATLQLTQGLATNFQAAGQELNSIIEGAPILAKAIAENLGGQSAADLKIFAQEGRITSEVFLKALVDAEDAIKAFEIPPTINRSVQRISNEFTRLGRESEVLRGLSGALAGVLDGLANNLSTIINLATSLAVGVLPVLVGLFARQLPAAILATRNAVLALNLAVRANPLVFFASTIATVITALFTFRKDIFETLRGVDVFGVGVTDVFFTIKNVAIEIFRGLASIIATPFRIALDIARSVVAQAKVLANELPFVNLNVTEQDRKLAGENILDITSRNLRETGDFVSGAQSRAVNRTLADIREFSRITDDVGLTDTGNGSITNTPPIIENIENANDALIKSKDITKDIGDNFNNVANDFGDGLVDAFRRGFEGGEGFLGRFTAGARNAMQNLFADITRVIAQPIFRNIASGVVGAGAGASSGGFSLGSLSSLSSVLNGGGPITLGGLVPGGIGRSLGFAQALPKGVFGPAAPGSIFGSTTLGGALSGGAIGGLAANLFGLGSGNFVQDTAFGGAGTLAGAFLGGPIGAGIGSFLGTALGGLFGGKKPSDKSQFSTLDLATLGIETGGLSGKKFSQENRDFADRVTQEASNLAQLLKEAGATLGGALTVVVGNRDGLRVNGQNFGNDSDAFIQGITQAVLDSVADAPSDLATLLSNTQGFDTAELAEALGILELIRSFERAGEAARPLGDALDALDEQFNQLRDRTQELGLPTDKLTESYEKQKDTLIKNVLSPLQDFLDQQALSSSSSLNPTQRLSLARSAFDENLAAIQGGDFSNLSQLTNQAAQLLSIGRDVFASGAGFTALESFVRQSVAGVAGDLGAEGGLNDSVFREITLSNAQQISLQEQMLLELREAREENIRLRKAMERVGNSLVVSS